jgi:GTP-binding protein
MSEQNQQKQEKIRNIAIIAHVDHGKTTLVDAFLKQSNLFRSNQEEMQQQQIMDSGELEREKGITIKAKNAAITFEDYKINIIDTPGHADFGGEVERTLHMADGCLLLVDAQEGPMPQTKFVLKKALELGLKPILVINKIDKKHASPAKVLDKVHDLFLQLATRDDQLDFPVFYAIARDGKVFSELPSADSAGNFPDSDMRPILDEIVASVPAPTGDASEPAQMLISNLEFNQYLGRLMIGKLNRGKLKIDQAVVVLSKELREQGRIKKLFVREGLVWKEVTEVRAGEIIAIAGLDSKAIGGTLCSMEREEALPELVISNPAVQIRFEANTSPLVGKDGKFVTAKQLQQRLEQEVETNISLKIEKGEAGSYYVAGRGELQLSILIEELRREGYEFQIRRPQVLFEQRDGKEFEPLEELIIDVPEAYLGTVNTIMSERNAELVNIETESGHSKFSYKILTRNLLGLRNELLTATKGNAILNNFLLDYVEVTQQKPRFRKGVLISSDKGIAMGYSLNTIQERGDLFIPAGTEVYEGMIIGINKYEQELEVNPTKERQKSGVRMKHDEITQTSLKPLVPLTLEFALGFLAEDELLEVTPNHLRLRKLYLTKTERDWSKRQNLTEFAKKQLGIK